MSMAKSSDRGWLRDPHSGPINSDCKDLRERLGIKGALKASAWTLSGGNQQKVVLGKWLLCAPRLLMLDEPTRGVDVRSKAEIHEYLRNAAAEGMALLVSSSEYDELLDFCDRIVVLFRGRVIADIPREKATEAMLAAMAGGVEGAE
jgi:ABC-type sugar transport system ATPase subunit